MQLGPIYDHSLIPHSSAINQITADQVDSASANPKKSEQNEIKITATSCLQANRWKSISLLAVTSLLALSFVERRDLNPSEPSKILHDHEWCQHLHSDGISSLMKNTFSEKIEEQHSWLNLFSEESSLVQPISCADPTTWAMPKVNPRRLSSLGIQREIKKHGFSYEDFTLDSGETPDRCLIDGHNCLLSQSNLEGVDRSTPIILMAHGFTATSYGWNDFARYIEANSKGSIRYSQVTLGGHGRSIEEFKKTDWHNWGKPIIDEYNALVEKGFSNISLVGSSTACALILEQLSSGSYSREKITPKNVFLIDPIVEPLNSINSIIVAVGAFAGQSLGPTRASSPEELSNWYGDYPFTSLQSLDDLTKNVKNRLDQGFELPPRTKLTVWASQGDPIVNPAGYTIIQRGIKPGDGGDVEYHPVESRLHVFTRLSGRPEATQEDEELICGDTPPLTRDEVVKQVKSRSMPFTPSDRQKQKRIFDSMLKSMMM